MFFFLAGACTRAVCGEGEMGNGEAYMMMIICYCGCGTRDVDVCR